MTSTHQLITSLRARLQQHETRKIHRASGVSEIIIRRIRNGLEQNVRLSTVDRLNDALDAVEGVHS